MSGFEQSFEEAAKNLKAIAGEDIYDGKQAVVDRLETALADKMDENVSLLQEMLRKEQLLKDATKVISSVQTLVDERGFPEPEPQQTEKEKEKEENKDDNNEGEGEGEGKDILKTNTGLLSPAETFQSFERAGVTEGTIGKKLAPYNPTNEDCCDIALEMLSVGPGDVLYDLGCGDARMLVQGAERAGNTFRGVGLEYDRAVYDKATQLVESKGLGWQITLEHGNVLDMAMDELDSATCIFVYLVPEGMRALQDRLIACVDRGVRVVTYVFSLPGLEPLRTELYKKSTKLYLYQKQ